jgi:hypothetical protein
MLSSHRCAPKSTPVSPDFPYFAASRKKHCTRSWTCQPRVQFFNATRSHAAGAARAPDDLRCREGQLVLFAETKGILAPVEAYFLFLPAGLHPKIPVAPAIVSA